MHLKPALLFLVVGTLAVTSAHAVTETDSNNPTAANTYDGDISNSDLINGLTPSSAIYTVTAGGHTAGTTLTSGDNSFPLSGINDGQQGSVNDEVSSTSGSTLFAAGQLGTSLLAVPQITYSLNTTANPLGYTLTNINSIFGFNGNNGYSAELADQDYTISYSTVAAPTVFLSLYSVYYSPFGNVNLDGTDAAGSKAAGTEVTLNDLGVTGVAAIQFTFSLSANQDGNQEGSYIREIDVNGVPTIATPEPSTFALVALALLGGGFLMRRQLARA